MFRLVSAVGFGLLGASVSWAETAADCGALFAEFRQKYPVDLSQCKPDEVQYALKECAKPDGFVGEVPVTHVILALDASGSMAGRSGAVTKMDAAKREAKAFLGDLHRTAKVSLVVYGHKGDNTEAGKGASCAQTQTLHGFNDAKTVLGASIDSLGPVGWTPLAGALDYIRAEVEQLPQETGGKTTAPVVYMISDGEETCGGDPVAAARALAKEGIRTTINTIGFDADAETRAQLEAIAEAGGGTYYPAKDAAALQAQLNAIKDARREIHQYNLCVVSNAAKISRAYQNVSSTLTRCYGKNDPNKFVSKVLRELNNADADSPMGQCKDQVFSDALDFARSNAGWIKENIHPYVAGAVEATDAYFNEMGLVQIEK